jgi:hypothetical protein
VGPDRGLSVELPAGEGVTHSGFNPTAIDHRLPAPSTRCQVRHDVLVATWLSVALALSCYVQVTQAETFIVGPSATYTHIQDAIGSAQPGDSILVLPATYLENLDFMGKSLVLISASGPLTTIIDGRAEDIATIRLVNGEDSRTSIVGFTITGGR